MADMVESINKWPANKKIAAALLLVITVTGMVLLVTWTQRPDYQLLYTNLTEGDSGGIVQKLQEMNVPYKAKRSGVFVPSDQVYDLRLRLAAEGLPHGGAVGFELFDETDFGVTDFVQKLNYRRAMQGELSRTIASLQDVDRARVHLAIPERSLFAPESSRPRASVLVHLRGGRNLPPGQVRAITNLVASSVEGMEASDVTVVDQRGSLLTNPESNEPGMSNRQLEYQRSFENDLEKRIVNILEPVVGRGKVNAKVAAVMDFTRIESTEETYDPEGQVIRSEQKNSEKSSSPTRGGVVGTASNLPGRTSQGVSANASSQIQSEVVNYEISKITKHIITATGQVKRLTAAVLVDGTYNAETKEYIPRTDEDLRRYEDLVKQTMGYMAERGDEVQMTNMPFEVAVIEELPEEKADYVALGARVAKSIAPVLAVLLFFLVVLRPLLKMLSTPSEVAPAGVFARRALGESGEVPALPGAAGALPMLETAKPVGVKGQVHQWADQNPKEAADLLRGWMEESR